VTIFSSRWTHSVFHWEKKRNGRLNHFAFN